MPLSPGGYYWAVGGSNYTEGECDVPGELSEIRGFIVEGQAVELSVVSAGGGGDRRPAIGERASEDARSLAFCSSSGGLSPFFLV